MATTTLVFLIAVPLAVLAERYDFPGKGLFSALVLVPMILPPFVGAIGMRIILGQWGALNALLRSIGLLGAGQAIDWLGEGQFWGVVLMEALHLYPILYLNARRRWPTSTRRWTRRPRTWGPRRGGGSARSRCR